MSMENVFGVSNLPFFKTLTVSDKNTLKNIPAVPGLLSYSQDNKQLYVNNGKQWDALSSETEVE